MVLTLDHLQHQVHSTHHTAKKASFVKEIGALGLIFGGVLVVSIVFINLWLFYQSALEFFGQEKKVHSVAPLIAQQDTSQTITALLHTPLDQIKDEIEQQIRQYTTTTWEEENSLVTMQTLVKSRMGSYGFEFNTVPPNNTLVVTSVGIEAPIIDLYYKSADHIKEGDFDKELYHGVVKYPSTPTPDKTGNMLIFWHTSYYRWKHNGYGTIFSKLPKMEHGNEIQLTRQGQLYTYEVIEKIVVRPKDVDDVYLKYKDGQYLTLMWCYPLGTDQRRMLIIAKRKQKPSTLTYNTSQKSF